MPPIRDYTFLRSDSGIYRTFGDVHPSDGILALLRYYRDSTGWHKPPIFGAEVLTGPILDYYDVPLRTVDHYGITLGLLPLSTLPAVRCYDPLDRQQQDLIHEFRRFAEAGTTIGLTGSRLVGRDSASSDLDLVFYGDNAAASGHALLQELMLPGASLLDISSTVHRMTDLTGTLIPRMSSRNIFKGLIRWREQTVKIDLHYGNSAHPVQHLDNFPHMSKIAEETLAKFIVEDSRGRRHFPGFLTCRHRKGYTTRVWIRDHILAFLLEGDYFSVRGYNVHREDRLEFVGGEVIDLWLR